VEIALDRRHRREILRQHPPLKIARHQAEGRFKYITQIGRSSGQGVKIAALTATVTDHQRELCKAARFDGLIGNPIEMGELYATVDTVTRWPRPSAGRSSSFAGWISDKVNSFCALEMAPDQKVRALLVNQR
jgi:hypothetical protein